MSNITYPLVIPTPMGVGTGLGGRFPEPYSPVLKESN